MRPRKLLARKSADDADREHAGAIGGNDSVDRILENHDAVTSLKNNILFSDEGKIECHRLNRYDRAGSYLLEPDPANLQADPLIAEFQNGTVKLADRSPASQLGIAAIDVSDAGPRP